MAAVVLPLVLGLSVTASAARFQAVSALLVSGQESCLAPNGAIDPGETNTVTFTFKNTTGTAVKDVKVALQSEVNNVAFAVNGRPTAGDITKDGIFSVVIRFRADGPCGGTLSPRFRIEGKEADGTPFAGVDIGSTGAEAFDFLLGATVTNTFGFSNTTRIILSDFAPNSDLTKENGRAEPYPSVISVTGVPNEAGRTGERIRNVTVTLNGLTHTYTPDLAAVLMSPRGRKFVLMRNAGGRVAGRDTAVDGLTLTFDGTSSAELPYSRQLVSGSVKPSDYGRGDLIPGQVPAEPYSNDLGLLNGPALGAAATAADVAFTDPNGAWKLYVTDTNQGDFGVIAGGWNLQITTSRIVCCGAGNTYPTITMDGNGAAATNAFPVAVTPPIVSGVIRGPGDFDADGHSDLIFQDATGFLAAWLLEETRLKTAAFLTPSHVGDTRYRAVAAGDFNGDRHPDLLFQHEDGTLAVWSMNGTEQTTAVLLSPSHPGDPSWRVAAIGDLDQDGWVDLVFQHTDGTLAVWYLQGLQLKSASLLEPNRPDDPNWRVVGTGDFNADGWIDLVFQHADGSLAVWYLKGRQLAGSARLTPSTPGDANWRVVSTVDRDRDGKPDLLFQHRGDGSLAVWFLQGVQLSSAQLLTPPMPGGTWKVTAP